MTDETKPDLTVRGTERIRAKPYRARKKKPKPRSPYGNKRGTMKLSRVRAQEILDRISDGAPLDVAVYASGVTKLTFDTWMKKAGAGIEPYVTFEREFRSAVARREADFLAVVADEAKNGDRLKAATWALEHLYGSKYSSKNTLSIEHSVADAPPTPEELNNITELLRSGVTRALPPDTEEADYEEVTGYDDGSGTGDGDEGSGDEGIPDSEDEQEPED